MAPSGACISCLLLVVDDAINGGPVWRLLVLDAAARCDLWALRFDELEAQETLGAP